MRQGLNLAIVGATGIVGETMIRVLEERKFPVNNLYLLASERSEGKTASFCGQTLTVENLENFNFNLVDIALFTAGGSISKEFAPKAVGAGCIVIDNTSCFRYEADIPLVIPEINPASIANYSQRGIIANPNCSTIQMLVALKPIHDAIGITRINVATYQAVSGTGKKAINELVNQVGSLLSGLPPIASVYPQQIAFNVLPQIDEFLENGYTREEMKMVLETKKILEDDNILINPTTVRVPVIFGHSEAIHLELKAPATVPEIHNLLRTAPGVELIDAPDTQSYPTPIKHAIGSDTVYVGRVRQDISHPNGLNLWVVADNTRKGAATNAIQIAEILYNEYI